MTKFTVTKHFVDFIDTSKFLLFLWTVTDGWQPRYRALQNVKYTGSYTTVTGWVTAARYSETLP